MAKHNSKRGYGDCEGPFGFPMPSALASEIDRLWKDVSSEIKTLGYQRRASVSAASNFSEDERADTSYVTSDAVDRDREVVLPEGGDWKEFKKNPVVTFAHRYDELPVGRAAWVKRVQDKVNGWLAKTLYTERPDDWEGSWFADAVWHFVKSGVLRGKSIGFLPLAGSAPEEKEIKARPELAGVSFMIRKWLALEYAVAPVQSNPDALVTAVNKAKELGLEVPGVIFEETGMVIPFDIPSLDTFFADTKQTKPLPTPNTGESKQDFISRCMGNDSMGNEYPEMEQRVAVCNAQWDEHKPKRAPRHIVTAESLMRELGSLDVSKSVAEEIARLKGRV